MNHLREVAGLRSKQIIAAVSGGPDSMALAMLLQEYCAAVPLRLITVTFDHSLRPESAEEAAFVHATLTRSGIYNVVENLGLEDLHLPSSKIQETARNMRYERLLSLAHHFGSRCVNSAGPPLALPAHISLRYVCTGHHFNDQIETFLYRLSRASGIPGLGAIQPLSTRQGIAILRPFLQVGIPYFTPPAIS